MICRLLGPEGPSGPVGPGPEVKAANEAAAATDRFPPIVRSLRATQSFRPTLGSIGTYWRYYWFTQIQAE